MHKPPLRGLIALQFSFCLALGAGFGLGQSSSAGISSLLGGFSIALANSWYLNRMFRTKLGGDSAKVLGSFYRAEIGKIVVLTALLAVVLVLSRSLEMTSRFTLETAALFGSFLLASVFVTLSNAWKLSNWLNTSDGQSK